MNLKHFGPVQAWTDNGWHMGRIAAPIAVMSRLEANRSADIGNIPRLKPLSRKDFPRKGPYSRRIPSGYDSPQPSMSAPQIPDEGRHRENIHLGAAALLGEVFFLVVISTIAKSLYTEVSVPVLLLLRYAFSLPLLLAAGLATRGAQALAIVNRQAQMMRCIFGLTALVGWYFAITLIEISRVVALVQVMPVFITILAPILLGESVGIRRWSAVAAGLVGVLVILKPGTEGWADFGNFLALGTAFVAALMFLSLRKLGQSDSPVSTAIWYNAFGSVVLLSWCLAFAQEWPTETAIWLVLAGCGALSSLQQLLLSLSHKLAPASKLAPFHFFAVPLSAASGILFFDEQITLTYVVGTSIIVGSAYYILVREGKRRR